ncbi:MAG TPA: hypothetical protein VFU86_16150, partial [Terriglobales bacterium]|nr:hypothetical protein [Terriglobales bacterium]
MNARGILCLTLLAASTLFAQQKPATEAGKASPNSQKHPIATGTRTTDTEATKTSDIRRLLELTGTRDMV